MRGETSGQRVKGHRLPGVSLNFSLNSLTIRYEQHRSRRGSSETTVPAVYIRPPYFIISLVPAATLSSSLVCLRQGEMQSPPLRMTFPNSLDVSFSRATSNGSPRAAAGKTDKF